MRNKSKKSERTQLKTSSDIVIEKAYKINYRRGQDNQMSYLYPSPSLKPKNYRPRYYTSDDTYKKVTSYDRWDYMNLGRSLFGGCPDLGGALLSKASWCVGPGSFQPIFTGKNQEWGNAAEKWLTEQFYPLCSVMGSNYPFTEMLRISSLALDVDGDSGLYFTLSRSGFPLVGLVASHRIGCRNDETVVTSGRFEGYRILDGTIVNDNGRAIGYRILGDTPDDEYDVSTSNFNLLYEPEWCDQYRGISRIARSVMDWTDQEDIDEFLKRGVKLAASIGLISKTESGNAIDSGANIVGAEEDAIEENKDNGLSVEEIQGGTILYMKSGANETLDTLKDERPSQNTEAFISRIQRRALYSIGWPQEMLDASKVGGASVRLVQDLVRKSISSRQSTLERRAKIIINYAVATAMNQNIIPQNNDDWYSWSFTKGGVISVDNGKEADIDRENFKLGMTTLSEIVSKRGYDWQSIRDQSQKEVEDLITRSKEISAKYGVPFETAMTLLQQNTPNQAPVSQPTTINEEIQQQ